MNEMPESDDFSVGDIVRVPITRISNSGSGITEFEDHDLQVNLGKVTDDSVGTVVEGEILEIKGQSIMARCLTDEAISYTPINRSDTGKYVNQFLKDLFYRTSGGARSGSVTIATEVDWIDPDRGLPMADVPGFPNDLKLAKKSVDGIETGDLVVVSLEHPGYGHVEHEAKFIRTKDPEERERYDLTFYAISDESTESQRQTFEEKKEEESTIVEDGAAIQLSGRDDRSRAVNKDELERKRKAAERAAQDNPERETSIDRSVSGSRYSRSEAVKDYARTRADGICELCGSTAPFKKQNGEPYLEVHHIDELGQGGADSPDRVAALCPTCHSEIHYGVDGDKLNNKLERKLDEEISELEKE